MPVFGETGRFIRDLNNCMALSSVLPIPANNNQ